MSLCVKCGAPLQPGAAFCSRCGQAVANPTISIVPQPIQRRAPWWIVPAVIVGIVAIAWLVLAGLPFGGERERDIAPARQSETIAEGTTSRDAGTVIDVPPQGMDDEPETTTTIATTTTSTTATIAPPPITIAPPITNTIATTPPPVRVAPPPAAPPPARTITEAEAAAELRGYVTSRNYYGVASECVRLNARGYQNEGYAFDIWHTCAGGGSSRLLGRWRVDAKTREVFRRNDDGRYLRP
ncbi:MAG TPA: zinc ribbon domain-containing protein [Thermoanaerobaculia bacterium]|nr:zinc ribbon domain-containing protein [Thermoanaerobaculia bacterium]